MDEKQALLALLAIRQDIEKNAKEYKLSEDEKKDANIVLNTLVSVVNSLIAKEELFCKCFFFKEEKEKTHAPIHFENYALKEHKNEGELMNDVSKQRLFISLIVEFIQCYEIVKKNGQVKEFLSRLNGYCIDGRVRGAFEFVRKKMDAPTFTDLLKNNIQKLPTENKSLYFYAFAEILKNSWGQPFSADDGKNGLSKTKGVINTDQFDLIKKSLEFLGFEPANDFLIAYDVLKEEQYQHLLPIYIKFLLSHENLLNEMGLNKQGIEVLKENKQEATPVVRGLYNKMIQDLIPIMSKTIRNNPDNYALDKKNFDLFIDFIGRASPATCFRILSLVPIHERPSERRIAMIQVLFKKLIWSEKQDSDEFHELREIKFGNQYTLPELLRLCKLNDEFSTIEKLILAKKIYPLKVKEKKAKSDAFKRLINEVNLELAGEFIKKGLIDLNTAQAILSEVMSQSQNPDVYIELFELTTSSQAKKESKEVVSFDSNIQDLSVDKRLYFYALVEIMKKSWGSQITLDGKTITVNSDQLTLISQYLIQKGYQPKNDFLTAYVALKEEVYAHLLPIYIKLILLHKDVLNNEGFTKLGMETADQLKLYKKIATPVERRLYDCMIKDLIPKMIEAIQEKSKSAELSENDFKLFADLLSRATPSTCFDILSVIPIHTRPPQKQIALINLLFLKFKFFMQEFPENGSELLQRKFGGKYTLMDLAEACNLTDICEAINKFFPARKEQKSDSVNEIFQLAVRGNQIENVKMMLAIKNIDVYPSLWMAVEQKKVESTTFDLLLSHTKLDVNCKKNNETLFACALKNDTSLNKIKSLIFYKGLDLKAALQLLKAAMPSKQGNYAQIRGWFRDREVMDKVPNVSNVHASLSANPVASSSSESVLPKEKTCMIC